MRRIVLTAEQLARATDLYLNSKMTVPMIAAEFGISRDVLTERLKEAGLERKRPGHFRKELDEASIQRMVLAYNDGSKLYDLSDEYGVSVAVIRRWLTERGVKIRHRAQMISNNEIARMQRLRNKGWTAERVAKLFRVCRQKVSYWTRAPEVVPCWTMNNLERLSAMRRRGMTWEKIHVETKAPFGDPSALSASYARYKAKVLELRLIENEVHVGVIHDLTARGLGAERIAAGLGTTARTVVRHRAGTTGKRREVTLPALDIQRIQRLLERRLSWVDINRRLGNPFECGSELEVAYNYILTRAADPVADDVAC